MVNMDEIPEEIGQRRVINLRAPRKNNKKPVHTIKHSYPVFPNTPNITTTRRVINLRAPRKNNKKYSTNKFETYNSPIPIYHPPKTPSPRLPNKPNSYKELLVTKKPGSTGFGYTIDRHREIAYNNKKNHHFINSTANFFLKNKKPVYIKWVNFESGNPITLGNSAKTYYVRPIKPASYSYSNNGKNQINFPANNNIQFLVIPKKSTFTGETNALQAAKNAKNKAVRLKNYNNRLKIKKLKNVRNKNARNARNKNARNKRAEEAKKLENARNKRAEEAKKLENVKNDTLQIFQYNNPRNLNKKVLTDAFKKFIKEKLGSNLEEIGIRIGTASVNGAVYKLGSNNKYVIKVVTNKNYFKRNFDNEVRVGHIEGIGEVGTRIYESYYHPYKINGKNVGFYRMDNLLKGKSDKDYTVLDLHSYLKSPCFRDAVIKIKVSKMIENLLLRFYKITSGWHGDLHGRNIQVVLKKNTCDISDAYIIDYDSHKNLPGLKNKNTLQNMFHEIYSNYNKLNHKTELHRWAGGPHRIRSNLNRAIVIGNTAALHHYNKAFNFVKKYHTNVADKKAAAAAADAKLKQKASNERLAIIEAMRLAKPPPIKKGGNIKRPTRKK